MMAFMNSFVVSVLVDNQPQREVAVDGKRTIRLPWDSEYKIRLKNKSGKRAMAEVEIDGVSIATMGKRFILEKGQTIDLERFVDDLDGGRKFRFVSADDPKNMGVIQDPTSSDNGCVRVKFYPELELTSWSSSGSTILRNSSPKIGSGGTWESSGIYGATLDCNMVDSSTTNYCVAGAAAPLSDKGATIEGGQSNQQFTASFGFMTENTPTIIEMWIKGPQERPVQYPTPNDWHVAYVGGRACIQYKTTPVHPVEWEIKDGNLRVVVQDFAFAKQFRNAEITDKGIEIKTSTFSVQ
jgi:hypothetical protein